MCRRLPPVLMTVVRVTKILVSVVSATEVLVPVNRGAGDSVLMNLAHEMGASVVFLLIDMVAD